MGNIEDYEGVIEDNIKDNYETVVKKSNNNITKEEVLKNPTRKRFKYLLNKFLEAGRMKTVNNDFMLQLYFHSLMGAYLKRYSVAKTAGYTDMRVPLIWVQNCLRYDTLIKTELGIKSLEELPNNFKVLSHNFKTGKDEWKDATKINTGVQELYEIVLENGKKIRGTGEHVLYLSDGKEIKIKDIKPGMDLYGIENLNVTSINKITADKTYDLTVDDNNNFYLSNKILSHNSGTGKSQMNKFTIDVANRIGVKATEVTYFSEAGLIGTYDRKSHEFNTTNNLSKIDNPQNEKGKVYKDPVVKGDLFYYDLVFIDEGKILFQKNSHAENILSILQPALDYPGRVRKKLAGLEPVEYDCDSTLVISTVPFKELNPELMLQGFFPRCLFYQKNVGITERLKNVKEMNKIFDDVKYNSLINDIHDVIKHPNPNYEIGRDRLKVKIRSQMVVDMVNEATEKWFLMSRDYTGVESQVLQAIISRLNVFIFKIAGQIAVLDNIIDTEDVSGYKTYLIEPEHVQYSIDLLDKILSILKSRMSFKKTKEDQSLLYRYGKITKNFIKHNKMYVTKVELINLYINIFNTTKQKAIKMFESDYVNNLFISTKHNGKYRYKLNSKLVNEYGLSMEDKNE